MTNSEYLTFPMRLWFVCVFMLAVFAGGVAAQAPEDVPAKIIGGPPFVLSDEAVAAGFDGEIAVALTINDVGEAKNIIVIAGPTWPCRSNPGRKLEELREAVKANVAAARFAPQIRKGKPVSSDVMIRFKLRPAKKPSDNTYSAGPPAAGTGNEPKMIQGGVINGKALSLPKPQYPREARANGASGAVTVQVLIDEEGKVVAAGATSGHPLLHDASRDAACGAKFAPTRLSGQPVKVTGIITYNFVR